MKAHVFAFLCSFSLISSFAQAGEGCPAPFCILTQDLIPQQKVKVLLDRTQKDVSLKLLQANSVKLIQQISHLGFLKKGKAYPIKYKGTETDLLLADINRDGKKEIALATYYPQGIGKLHIYSWDDSKKGLVEWVPYTRNDSEKIIPVGKFIDAFNFDAQSGKSIQIEEGKIQIPYQPIYSTAERSGSQPTPGRTLIYEVVEDKLVLSRQ